ncbi:MAG: cupin domain-containing protein [Pseudomonadota bacterium]|nr:cupin domain-containing protein [Pseudomonadota bacterium]
MHCRSLRFDNEFQVAFTVGQSQAAEMVLAPGGSTGGADNRHRGAEQWLYVVDGRGEAVVEGQSLALGPGSLLVIERGEAHEIRNTGDCPLKTLNFYQPPAFNADGGPVGPGRDH